MLFQEFKHCKTLSLNKLWLVIKERVIKSQSKVLIDCIISNINILIAYRLLNDYINIKDKYVPK